MKKLNLYILICTLTIIFSFCGGTPEKTNKHLDTNKAVGCVQLKKLMVYDLFCNFVTTSYIGYVFAGDVSKEDFEDEAWQGRVIISDAKQDIEQSYSKKDIIDMGNKVPIIGGFDIEHKDIETLKVILKGVKHYQLVGAHLKDEFLGNDEYKDKPFISKLLYADEVIFRFEKTDGTLIGADLNIKGVKLADKYDFSESNKGFSTAKKAYIGYVLRKPNPIYIKPKDKQKKAFNENPFNNNTKLEVLAMSDKGNGGVYKNGEKMFLSVKTNKDCYIKIINLGPSGNVTLLYPNPYQKDNKIKGNTELTIPDKSWGDFDWIAQKPFGNETIYIYARTEQFKEFENGFCEESFKTYGTYNDGNASNVGFRDFKVVKRNQDDQLEEDEIGLTLITKE